MDGQKAAWLDEQEKRKSGLSDEQEKTKMLQDNLKSYVIFKEAKDYLEKMGYTVEIYGDGCFPRVRVFKEVVTK